MMRKISTFFQKNEKWLTPTALLGGFVIDNLTLRRSDLLAENILLTVYFIVAGVGVLVWHRYENQNIKSVSSIERQSIVFLVTQFVFGGLFSSLTVFYIKSASFFASWPFLLVLFGGMIATEYFKKHFTQFLVQLATLYILLFTYFILITPLFFKKINIWVFLASGIGSLITIFLYVLIFKKLVPNLIKNKQKYIIFVVGGIYFLMHLFYFTNMIPPIPLALKDSGVYQKVEKQSGTYIFSNFTNHFSFKSMKKEYIVPGNSPIYFYSSVYAPVRFTQQIVHTWQKKNAKGDWVTMSKIAFPIYGGSNTGYRGYSISNNVTKGTYRVLVETDGEQVLGGEYFLIK
jgi:hypothetical protein